MEVNGVLISIVDDDQSLREAIKMLIQSVGLSAADFPSAEDFLSSGQSQDAACLVLDVRLPGIGGLELQRQLAAGGCRVPIVFISGHGDQEARTRALEAGAVDFLQKPFSEVALFNAINLALANHQSGAPGSSHPHQSV